MSVEVLPDDAAALAILRDAEAAESVFQKLSDEAFASWRKATQDLKDQFKIGTNPK